MKRTKLRPENYNYMYSGLEKSLEQALPFLAKIENHDLLAKLSPFKFNAEFQTKLEEVIRELTADTPEEKFEFDKNADPEEELERYQQEEVPQVRQDMPMTPEETNRGMAHYHLTRLEQDFSSSYKSISDEFETLCQANDHARLDTLLKECGWMADTLRDHRRDLILKAMNQKHKEVLEVLLERDQLPDAYRDINNILGRDEYHSTTPEIIEILTDYFIKVGNKFNALNYKGQYLYSHKEYEKAAEFFSQAIELDDEYVIVPMHYKALCYQYLGKSEQAVTAFEDIIKFDTEYGNADEIKARAQKALDQFNDKEKLTAKIKLSKGIIADFVIEFKEQKQDLLDPYKDSINDLLTKLRENLNSPPDATNIAKEVKDLLFKIKFINLKQGVKPEILLLQEFANLPYIHDKMLEDLGEEFVTQEKTYIDAIEFIDKTVEIVGETTESLLVEMI